MASTKPVSSTPSKRPPSKSQRRNAAKQRESTERMKKLAYTAVIALISILVYALFPRLSLLASSAVFGASSSSSSSSSTRSADAEIVQLAARNAPATLLLLKETEKVPTTIAKTEKVSFSSKSTSSDSTNNHNNYNNNENKENKSDDDKQNANTDEAALWILGGEGLATFSMQRWGSTPAVLGDVATRLAVKSSPFDLFALKSLFGEAVKAIDTPIRFGGKGKSKEEEQEKEKEKREEEEEEEEEYLTFRAIRYDPLKGIHQVAPPTRQPDSPPSNASWDAASLAGARGVGFTLIASHLERYGEHARNISDILSASFGHFTRLDMLATPPSAQGRGPRFLSEDIYIVQTQGQQRVTVLGQAVEAPCREDTMSKNLKRAEKFAAAGKPALLNVTMHEGEVVYIPRGFMFELRKFNRSSFYFVPRPRAFALI
eukprot:UC1_evm1s730